MKKKVIKSYAMIFAAVILTGLGADLFVYAGLGSDTITVFIDGLHKTFNISLGTGSRIYNLLIIIIALICSRKNIGLGTIIYCFTTGFAMDFFSLLLVPLNIGEANIVIRLICVLIDQILLCLAYALLIKYRMGMGPLDAVSYAVVEKTKISFRYIRTIADIVLLIAGYLLGGVVGIGSIIAMFTTGYCTDYILKFIKRG